MLRRAWDAAPAGGNTLLAQLKANAQSAADYESEDLQSAASNSHSASSQMPAAATAAAAEKTRAWYQIIEGFAVTRQFLINCAKYGLDAFQVQCAACFPNPLPAPLPDDQRLIIDTYGKWDLLCDKYGDDFANAGSVIGKTVDDSAIYLWLLNNPDLLNITKGVTEQRGEYTEAIIGRVGGVLYA